MKNVLFINACVRKNSRTKRLADAVLRLIGDKYNEVVLQNENLKPLDTVSLEKRESLLKAENYKDASFRLARDFAIADEIVIAAPYWEQSYPALLKIYLELISVNGITFTYGDDGMPKGLCRAKRLIYVTTSGGPLDPAFGYENIRSLALCMFGIKETLLIKAEMLDIIGNDADKITDDAIDALPDIIK